MFPLTCWQQVQPQYIKRTEAEVSWSVKAEAEGELQAFLLHCFCLQKCCFQPSLVGTQYQGLGLSLHGKGELISEQPQSCVSWLGGLTQHSNGIASHQPFLEIMGWTEVKGGPEEVARAGDTTQLGWLNLCKPLHGCSFAHWGSLCMLCMLYLPQPSPS